jgi:putative component of membrane protein insertase Oxa1/YidC/SpoIIIJ protein YidD
MALKLYSTTSKFVIDLGMRSLWSVYDDLDNIPQFLIPVTDKIATHATISTINIYKHFIDPHKPGKCAHRLLHNELSCSEYIRGVVGRNGAILATPLIERRFLECKDAYVVLRDREFPRTSATAICCSFG